MDAVFFNDFDRHDSLIIEEREDEVLFTHTAYFDYSTGECDVYSAIIPMDDFAQAARNFLATESASVNQLILKTEEGGKILILVGDIRWFTDNSKFRKILEKVALFEFPNGKEKIPSDISVIIWDVSGTITANDKIDENIISTILQTGEAGIKHIFITGRDRFWLDDFLVKYMRETAEKSSTESDKIMANMCFFAELGLIKLDSISGEPEVFQEILYHPLLRKNLRENLSSFFLQTTSLKKDENNKPPPHHYIIRDANGVGYLYPMFPDIMIKLPEFIWSDTKEIIGTAEVVRDSEKRITSHRQSKIELATYILKKFVEYWGIENEVSISPVSTAINITPKINGIALDKDWSAGRALQQISNETGLSVEDVARKTIAIGDGKADFLFSTPRLQEAPNLRIPFIFVGVESGYDDERGENVIIRATKGNSGPRVTREILKELGDRFKPL